MLEWNRFFSPASEAQINQFQRATGIGLPASYRHFLLTDNGGQPREEACFDIPEHQEKVMLGAMYGISDDADGVNLYSAYEDQQEDVPPGFVPIGEDPGGNLLLLATTGDNVGAVYFWDRIGFLAERTGKRLFWISGNFDDFLRSLEAMTG